MNRQLAKPSELVPRPSGPAAWFIGPLALCLLVAAELRWGAAIHDWLGGGRLSRERASIIASYCQKVGLDHLPQPAGTNAFEILHLDKGPPYRMAVRVRIQSGETRQFELVRPREESGTNWGFNPM